MAAKASVQVTGSGNVASAEVSGGDFADLSAAAGVRTFGVGTAGSMIQFLTVKRLGPGGITIRNAGGKLAIEVDGGKAKSLKSSYSFGSKTKRVLVKEPA